LLFEAGAHSLPDAARRALAADESTARAAAPDTHVGRLSADVPANAVHSFSARELTRLGVKITGIAGTLARLNTIGLARDAVSAQGSPVLMLTLPERLNAYIESVIIENSSFHDLPDQLDRHADAIISRMLGTGAGPKRRPDFTRLLWRLIFYVHRSTGHYHDRLVAAILNGAGVRLSSHGPLDEFALRTWRHRHPSTEQLTD
jgi:hypothetical protein